MDQTQWRFRLTRVTLCAVSFLCLTYGQSLTPRWIDADWSEANHPSADWYTGFSRNTLRAGTDVSDALRRLERDAQNKLVESIAVRITGSSTVDNRNARVRQGGESQSRSSSDYRQIVEATSSAEVAQMEVRSYHHAATNTIYAFAAVKRIDLANYYASQIDAALSEAQRSFDLARQYSGFGKKREAFQALNESQSRVESTASYRDLLMAVDTENGIRRSQGGRVNDMLKAIAAARVQAKNAMAVYVTGAERIHGQTSDIITSGLQTLLSESDFNIAESQEEAGYIIRIEANVCNEKGSAPVFFANACVKVTLSNMQTNKHESVASITGPKEGGGNKRAAAESAFRAVVQQVWNAVKGKI